MRNKIPAWLCSLVTTFALISGIASAHVVVTPNKVGIGEFQTFSVSVPSEKDTPTTALRLAIPSGLQEVTPTVKPGWDITTKGSPDNITEIDWSGGSVPPDMRDDFTFSAQAPAKPTALHWKAYQTYADGSVVSWNATPSGSDDANGDTGPYSITKVINDLQPSASSSSDSSTASMILAIASLVVAGLAFIKAYGR